MSENKKYKLFKHGSFSLPFAVYLRNKHEQMLLDDAETQEKINNSMFSMYVKPSPNGSENK